MAIGHTISLVDRLVAFSTLMENGDGIVSKSPDYILEKWRYCNASPDEEVLIGGHDMANTSKYLRWQSIWRRYREQDDQAG